MRVASTRRRRRSDSYLDAARSLFAAMSVQPSADRKSVINELIADLQTANVWPKLDGLVIPAAHDSQAAVLNWKTPGTNSIVGVGSPAFVADEGFTYGTGKYHTTGFNPATAGGNLTQNSASLGIYSLTENQESAIDVGITDGTNGLHIGSSWISGGKSVIISRCNSGVTIGSTATPTQTLGHIGMSRTGSTTYKTYQSGSPLQTITATSAAMVSLPIVVGAWNNNSTIAINCTKTLAAVYWGGGLSDAENLALATALDKYMASLATGYDVFIIAGQSNTQFGDTFATASDAGSRKVWQWASRGAITPAVDCLDHFTKAQSLQRVGFGLAFARDGYVPGSLAAGRRVLLVPCGANGTSFANNDWTNGTGTYWTQTVARANAALALPNTTLKGLLWMQGESDAIAGGAAVTNYQSRLDAALNGFRASIVGASNMPIVVGGMVPSWVGANAGRLAVQAVLADTPNRLSRCGYADPSTPSALTPTVANDIHYSAASQRSFGGRFYSAWAPL